MCIYTYTNIPIPKQKTVSSDEVYTLKNINTKNINVNYKNDRYLL